MKKIILSMAGYMLLTVSALSAQDKKNSAKNVFGFTYQKKEMVLARNDLFFEDTKLDFGPMTVGGFTLFLQRQTTKNLVLELVLDGQIATTTGIQGRVGIGYKFSKRKFNIVPLMGIGVGQLATQFESYELGEDPITLGSGTDKKVFVGPNDYNYGRGSGSNLDISLISPYILLKPDVQLQYFLGKVMLSASFGYNIGIKRAGKVEVSGKGYNSLDEWDESAEAPTTISSEYKVLDWLTDANGNKITDTPLALRGINWSLGIGYSF